MRCMTVRRDLMFGESSWYSYTYTELIVCVCECVYINFFFLRGETDTNTCTYVHHTLYCRTQSIKHSPPNTIGHDSPNLDSDICVCVRVCARVRVNFTGNIFTFRSKQSHLSIYAHTCLILVSTPRSRQFE